MATDLIQRTDKSDPARTQLLAGVVSGALIAFGILCWIAANWSGFHRFTKLGLVGAALLAAASFSLLMPRARVPALLVATATIGGLLALIGQIYPSGADAWQLFALWALLVVPFALAARHDAVWSLWVTVASAGIALWRVQEHSGADWRDWSPSWGLAIGLACILLPVPLVRKYLGDTTWAFRLAALGGIGLVAFDGGIGALEARTVPFVLGLAALCSATALFLVLRPLQLGLLAFLALAIDALLIIKLAIIISPRRFDMGGVLLIGVLAAGIVAGSVVLLRTAAARLTSAAPSEDAEGTDLQGDGASNGGGFSWPLALLSGVGALLAAIPFLLFYSLAFVGALETPTGAAGLGAVTLAGAVAILRGGAVLGFRQMFGMIGVAVGLGLIGLGAALASERNTGFVLFAVIVGIAAIVPVRWTRTLFGFAAASAFLSSLFMHATTDHVGLATAVASALTALAALTVLAPAWTNADPLPRKALDDATPFIHGWIAACLSLLVMLAGRPFLLGAGAAASELSGLFTPSSSRLSEIVSVLVATCGMGLLFGLRPTVRVPVAFALALVGVALSVVAPTLGPILFVLAVGLLAGQRTLTVAAALAALWVVSAAYYALHWTLTEKAWAMIGLGLALAAVALATGFLRRVPVSTAGTPQRRRRWPAILTTAGVLLTAGLAGTAVAGAESVLRNGREIFIALQPVDPRSLVAGDYMAIAFDTNRLPPASRFNREVLVRADLDDRSVATITGLAPDEAAAGGDGIQLRVRTKKRQWFVGSDAWFFAEGDADRYQNAKFGSFRVGSDGRLLLTGLADKDLRPIR